MVLHTCQEQPSGVFRHAAVQNIFGNTSGRLLMLVMTAGGNFAFTWIFWPMFRSMFKYSTQIIVQCEIVVEKNTRQLLK